MGRGPPPKLVLDAKYPPAYTLPLSSAAATVNPPRAPKSTDQAFEPSAHVVAIVGSAHNLDEGRADRTGAGDLQVVRIVLSLLSLLIEDTKRLPGTS